MKTRQPFEAGPYRGEFVPRHGTWRVLDEHGRVRVVTRYKKNAMAYAVGQAQWDHVLRSQPEEKGRRHDQLSSE